MAVELSPETPSCTEDVSRDDQNRHSMWLTERILHLLTMLGLTDAYVPFREHIASTIILASTGLLLFQFHVRERRRWARELEAARAQLLYQEDKLMEKPGPEEKEIRIFLDGSFDMFHFGHMNAFRLARSLGTHLVAGVNSDATITECKGAPLMNEQERLAMVSACKYVDEVCLSPYVMDKDYLEYIIQKHRIDFVVHGSDPCIVNGEDVYATAKQAGKFRTIPRTEGVSTTDIVGRMLLLTKEHHCHQEEVEHDEDKHLSFGRTRSKSLATSRMIQLFSAGVETPTSDMRVVYVDGAWDLFHPGHVAFLKAAREVSDLPSYLATMEMKHSMSLS